MCRNENTHASQSTLFFRMCFEVTVSGPTPGDIGGDCLMVKVSQDSGDPHTETKHQSGLGEI